jgi:hypothetical protein
MQGSQKRAAAQGLQRMCDARGQDNATDARDLGLRLHWRRRRGRWHAHLLPLLSKSKEAFLGRRNACLLAPSKAVSRWKMPHCIAPPQQNHVFSKAKPLDHSSSKHCPGTRCRQTRPQLASGPRERTLASWCLQRLTLAVQRKGSRPRWGGVEGCRGTATAPARVSFCLDCQPNWATR